MAFVDGLFEEKKGYYEDKILKINFNFENEWFVEGIEIKNEKCIENCLVDGSYCEIYNNLKKAIDNNLYDDSFNDDFMEGEWGFYKNNGIYYKKKEWDVYGKLVVLWKVKNYKFVIVINYNIGIGLGEVRYFICK